MTKLKEAIAKMLDGSIVNDVVNQLLESKYFVSTYNDFIMGKASLKQAGDELNKWAKIYAHKDANRVRSVVTNLLDPLLKPKGLEVTFKKDNHTYWGSQYTVDYQVNVMTKGLRVGAPGGDKLIEVQLFYYPNGLEEFQVTEYDIDGVLGPGTYVNIRSKLLIALAKEFPKKREAVPNYDFKAEAMKGVKQITHKSFGVPTPKGPASKNVTNLGGGTVIWNGKGGYSAFESAVKPIYKKYGERILVNRYKSKKSINLSFGNIHGRKDAWVVYELQGKSKHILWTFNSFPKDPSKQTKAFLDALSYYYRTVLQRLP